MLRVLQVGLGPLGIKIVSDLHRRRLGQVVACIDPAHAGQSLAKLVAGAADVPIIGSLAELATPVDIAIVATVSDLRACAPTLIALAEHKISSVSTCEELAWPWDRYPEVAHQLAAAAQRHGVRMLGTG